MLHLITASVSIPHPEKLHKHGEDANFIHRRAIGVFDGVGGWAEKGIDAGRYSKQLSRLTEKHFRTNGHCAVAKSLAYASSKTNLEGSSTACVVAMHGDRLQGLNVGDSGVIIFRKGAQVYSTREQLHGFNYPYQISFSNQSDLKLAERIDFRLKEGDILVVATDGLWDNVFQKKILEKVKRHVNRWKRVDKSHHGVEDFRSATERFEHALHTVIVRECNSNAEQKPDGKRLQELAFDIAGKACTMGHNKKAVTPFSRKSKRTKMLHSGGKLDDITVVVGMVTTSDQRYRVSVEGVCPTCDQKAK